MDIFDRSRCPRCGSVPLVLRAIRRIRRPPVIVAECVFCGHEYEIDRDRLREAVTA